MPDDDWALGQNEVDVRNEARREYQRHQIPMLEQETLFDQQTAICTNDEHCRAGADEHHPDCPVEHRLQDEVRGVLMTRQAPWFADLDHLRWLGEHGGGDELADANCWRDVKPYFARLLAVAEAAWEFTEINAQKSSNLTSEWNDAVGELHRAVAEVANSQPIPNPQPHGRR